MYYLDNFDIIPIFESEGRYIVNYKDIYGLIDPVSYLSESRNINKEDIFIVVNDYDLINNTDLIYESNVIIDPSIGYKECINYINESIEMNDLSILDEYVDNRRKDGSYPIGIYTRPNIREKIHRIGYHLDKHKGKIAVAGLGGLLLGGELLSNTLDDSLKERHLNTAKQTLENKLKTATGSRKNKIQRLIDKIKDLLIKIKNRIKNNRGGKK